MNCTALLVFVCLVCGYSESSSQGFKDKTSDSRYWINFGRGATFRKNYIGPTTSFSLNYAKDIYSVSARFINAENLVTGLETTITSSLKTISELGVVFGLNDKREFTCVSAAIGLGYTSARNDERFGGEAFVAYGLTLEVQSFLLVTPIFGIGITSYADINEKKTFGGIVLCVQFGKLD